MDVFRPMMLLMIGLLMSTAGCTVIHQDPEPDPLPVVVPPTPPPAIAGAIYQNGYDLRLFDDPKASRVENNWESSNSFSGGGSSSQSNKLDGRITVTITEVYPNGNLFVSGDKWITLNQGREYVRITGIVRRQDILPDNTIESMRVADAQIIYSGKGALAEANQVGWLSRFFMSPLWPM